MIDAFVAQRLPGLLIVPVGGDHSYLAREMELGTSIAFLDRPPHNLAADTITLDDRGGARAAVEHLIAHGHRRIATLVQPMHLYTMVERYRGYVDALEAAGIAVDEACVRHAETVEDAQAATMALLESPAPPTAIFCANNRMSVGAVMALADERDHVAVVVFDDLELAEALAVPLTVVRTDAAELGRAGAELLMRRLGGWRGAPTTLTLPATLVTRGSGEIAAG